jgi:hypothetical protein
VCRRFCAASDNQRGLTVREHYASPWSLSIKTWVPNVMNATGAIGLARPLVRGYEMSGVEVKAGPKLTT